MSRLVTAFALSALLLSGCGMATPMMTQSHTTASAQDYNMTFDEARHTADRTRFAYDDLRYKASMTVNQDAKDRVEEEMVAVLVKGLESIRALVKDNPDKSCRWTFEKADTALKTYSGLKVRWALTDDKAMRRSLINQMQHVLLEALELRSIVAR